MHARSIHRSHRGLVAVALTLIVVVAALVPPQQARADVSAYSEVSSYRWPGNAGMGKAIALSGEIAAVTRTYSGSEPDTGSVEVMQLDDGGGVLSSQTISAPLGSIGFGEALAVDETRGRLIVGASFSNTVYEYLKSDATWHLNRTITPPSLAGTNPFRFGSAVALRGDGLVIGAFTTWVDGVYSSGAVYFADLLGEDVRLLKVPGAQPASSLGTAVAINDDYIVGGAHQIRSTVNGTSLQTGGVYIWSRADLSAPPRFLSQPIGPKTLVQRGTGGGYGAGFGYAIALGETDVFISSPSEVDYRSDDVNDPVDGANQSSLDTGGTTQGAVYRFALDDLSPIGGKILPPPHEGDAGLRISVAGDALLVSSATADDKYRGAVSVYDIPTLATTVDPVALGRQQPEPVQRLRASDSRENDFFGSSLIGGGIAADGTSALVGNVGRSGQSQNAGAYLFRPLAPNVAAHRITLSSAPIVYGQPGSVTVQVEELTRRVTVHLELDGADFVDRTDTSGKATFSYLPTKLDAGQYPLHAFIESADPTESGEGDGIHEVRKAKTTIVVTEKRTIE